MTSDGKRLEMLVAFVEQRLLPSGFEVKTNQIITNDAGVQIAEFDIEIRGKVGTTEFSWLIECRDRPSQGAAPASWIEQLVGRKDRFLFNKVTAVSTTGFSEGAREFARSKGIELRAVRNLSPDDFSDWLMVPSFTFMERRAELAGAVFVISIEDGQEKVDAVNAALVRATNSMVLNKALTGERVELRHAFLGAIEHTGNCFDGLEPNGPSRSVRMEVTYEGNDHFVIATQAGAVRLRQIIYQGTLSIKQTDLPIAVATEYRMDSGTAPISQYVSFEPFNVHGKAMALEMHRIPETEGTHIALRVLGDTPSTS